MLGKRITRREAGRIAVMAMVGWGVWQIWPVRFGLTRCILGEEPTEALGEVPKEYRPISGNVYIFESVEFIDKKIPLLKSKDNPVVLDRGTLEKMIDDPELKFQRHPFAIQGRRGFHYEDTLGMKTVSLSGDFLSSCPGECPWSDAEHRFIAINGINNAMRELDVEERELDSRIVAVVKMSVSKTDFFEYPPPDSPQEIIEQCLVKAYRHYGINSACPAEKGIYAFRVKTLYRENLEDWVVLEIASTGNGR